MKRAYSIQEIRDAEKHAMEKVSSLDLMERAGKILAEIVLKTAKKLDFKEVLFVCGGGNNGGDGFCAAELLREKLEVSVLCLAEQFSFDCEHMRNLFKGEILGRIPRRRYPLIVECLLGTGAKGEPRGKTKELVDFIGRNGAYVIACDLPAGLSEGGICAPTHVKADRTVTIGGYKQALLLSDGADIAGEIFLADIGLLPEGGAEIWEERDVSALFPTRKSHVNKGNFGKAAILAFPNEYPNAPLFSASACLRSGVGYTQLFATEPLFTAAIGKNSAMLQKFDLSRAMQADAIAFGMGAGDSSKVYETLCILLKEYEGILILDADALNACARFGTEILKEKKCRAVLTPHIGEFARLTKRSAEEILVNPVSVAQAFAREHKVTLILKNNRSVITDGVRTAINTTGCSALSKGGSGDILSGFLAGTCARGIQPFEAACASCYLLGRAGELASKQKGEYGATVEDIIALLVL